MKWLTPILAMLLFVGCSRSESNIWAERKEITTTTPRGGTQGELVERSVVVPFVVLPPEATQPPPDVPSQPKKSEPVQEQQKERIGYRARMDPVTGKHIFYPVYENEKK